MTHDTNGNASSTNGAPHLTINPDGAFANDSSNSFEEKLLEVWFAASSDVLPPTTAPRGLKSVSVSRWTEMLDLVHCKILSVIESDEVDAYLLSESSMFVFPHKLVLKTCGITTLLSGLPAILEIAASVGFPVAKKEGVSTKGDAAETYRVFYSRKNFLYPDQQRGPHRSWREEMNALDELFERGAAYVIGKLNGEHWYLYITEPEDEGDDGRGGEESEEVEKRKVVQVSEDETLEILMTDLDETHAKQFYYEHAAKTARSRLTKEYHEAQEESKHALEEGANESFTTGSGNGATAKDTASPAAVTEGHALGTVVSDTSGLADVYPCDRYPEARIDAYLFEPCGFSANGVVPAPKQDSSSTSTSTHYFTVHVTPEPQCSFASFETNVPVRQTGRETAELVEQVVAIFRPGRFTVTLFEAKSPDGDAPRHRARNDTVKGYRRIDRIVHDLDGYDLVFRYYERHDWKGGKPRLGENS